MQLFAPHFKQVFTELLMAAVSAVSLLLCACQQGNKQTGKHEAIAVYNGYVKYGDAVSDSAQVVLLRGDDNKIQMVVNSGLPYLSASFPEVNVQIDGEKSVLKAHDETLDTGMEDCVDVHLYGVISEGNKRLDLRMVGTDMKDTLFFSTEAFATADSTKASVAE